MTPQRAALQLYSVRDLPQSLPDIIRNANEEGFDGVEFADRFKTEPVEQINDALLETGIEPVAVHTSLSTIEQALRGETDLIERCHVVDCYRLIIPHLSASTFRTSRDVKRLVHRLRDLADRLASHDIQLGVHNDRRMLWPLLPDIGGEIIENTPIPESAANLFQQSTGRLRRTNGSSAPTSTALLQLLDLTGPQEVFFELEIAEILAAGFDPQALIEVFDGRAKLIHLRDVDRTGRLNGYKNVPHGDGLVDMQGIIEDSSTAGIQWVVYENELDIDTYSKITHGAALLDRLC